MAVYTSNFTGQGIDEALGKIKTLESSLTALEAKEDGAIAELKTRIEALEAELKGSTPGSTPEQGTDQGTNSGTEEGSSEPTEPSEPTEGPVEGTPEEEIPEQNA